MLPVEVVFALLDNLRAETIDGLASPGNPTAFGFGALHGQLKAIEELRDRLNTAIEQSASDEDKF